MSPVPPGVPRRMPPEPLERGLAAGMLTGMLLVGLGLVFAAAVGLSGRVGQPLQLIGMGLAVLGAGVVGLLLRRGTAPLPDGPIWSPSGLRALARALDLPAVGVMVGVYGATALGVAGTVAAPLLDG